MGKKSALGLAKELDRENKEEFFEWLFNQYNVYGNKADAKKYFRKMNKQALKEFIEYCMYNKNCLESLGMLYDLYL